MVLLVVHLSKCKSLAGMIFGWNQRKTIDGFSKVRMILSIMHLATYLAAERD